MDQGKTSVCLNPKCDHDRYIEDLNQHFPLHREHASYIFRFEELSDKLIKSNIEQNAQRINNLLTQRGEEIQKAVTIAINKQLEMIRGVLDKRFGGVMAVGKTIELLLTKQKDISEENLVYLGKFINDNRVRREVVVEEQINMHFQLMKNKIIDTLKSNIEFKELSIAPVWSSTLKTGNVQIHDTIAVSTRKEDAIAMLEAEILPDQQVRIRYSFPTNCEPTVRVGLLDASKDQLSLSGNINFESKWQTSNKHLYSVQSKSGCTSLKSLELSTHHRSDLHGSNNGPQFGQKQILCLKYTSSAEFIVENEATGKWVCIPTQFDKGARLHFGVHMFGCSCEIVH